MSKATLVEDEQGWPWLVYEEDPGYTYVKQLKQLGIEYLVLPRVLLMGEVEIPEPEAPVWSSDINLTPALTRLVIRRHRLYDCLSYLRGGTIGVS